MFNWFKKKNGKGAVSKKSGLRLERKTEFFCVEEMKNHYEAVGLGWLFEELKPQLRNAIRISLIRQEEEVIPVGKSKVGGYADLPKNAKWPTSGENRPLFFRAQINLRDVAAFDINNELPKEGMLYFFTDSEDKIWGFEVEGRDFHKVLFVPSVENLERTSPPAREEEYGNDYIDGCASMEFRRTLELPGMFSYHFDIAQEKNEDYNSDNYFEYIAEQEYSKDMVYNAIHKLLGHSENVQGSMEDQCQYTSNGIDTGSSEGYNNPKIESLKSGIKDWVLLFQLDSDHDKNSGMDFMWGDMGRLYFWIRKQDLKNKDFSKTWLILQCG